MRPTYGELITSLKHNEVFVMGSNLKGFHAAGAAGYASFGRTGNVWREEGYGHKPNGWKGKWNVKGVGEGYQEGTEGKSYALPTVTKAGHKLSLSEEEIVENIKRFYEFARANPYLMFLVAYSAKGVLLNGYSHRAMAKMFKNAGDIPDNVVFSDSYQKLIDETKI